MQKQLMGWLGRRSITEIKEGLQRRKGGPKQQIAHTSVSVSISLDSSALEANFFKASTALWTPFNTYASTSWEAAHLYMSQNFEFDVFDFIR